MGVLSVVLAILALLVSFFGVVLYGNIAGYIAIALAVVAGVLGFMKRKKDGKGGIPAIVIGVLAIILAFSLIGTTETLVKQLKDEIIKSTGDKYQMTQKYVDKAKTDNGFMGFITSMLADVAPEDREQLEKELSDVAKLINDSRDGAENKVEETVNKIEEKVDETQEKIDETLKDAGEKLEETGEKIEETVNQVLPDGGNT